MKKYILMFVIFFISFTVKSQNPVLTVNTSIVSKDSISPELFGGFIEFLNHFVNGPRGHWAQELYDRGFDIKGDGISLEWNKSGDLENSGIQWTLDSGGYNANGLYCQKISINSDGNAGIFQDIYLNDSVSHTFYIYHKGKLDGDSLFISICDTLNGEVYFRKGIYVQQDDWRKSELTIPPLKDKHKARLIISIESGGYILLDEASLMPDNNVFGMRKEFYDIYKIWRPGVIRYPGGRFADRLVNKLEYSIGDIDQRKSPNISTDNYNQRMDFGVDEFVEFCKSLNIEPHITVNFENGTVQEALNYLEYCNGDTNTPFGNLRALNGHSEPYNIKYWEIGNEQWWSREPIYAEGYPVYYDAMKAKDNNIKIIMNGNHWNGYKNFEMLFTKAGSKCDIFSFHPTVNGTPQSETNDSIRFLAVTAASYFYEKGIYDNYEKWFQEWNLPSTVKQGIGEWWTDYGKSGDWLLDTNIRNCSLESGITGAAMINSVMKYPGRIVLGERTCGLGMFRCGIDQLSAKRTFYGSPTLYALSMLSNHRGTKVVDYDMQCEVYNLPEIIGFSFRGDNPFIDALVTANIDSIYINLINRYTTGNTVININIDKNLNGLIAKVYELYSESVTDANTGETPVKIYPKEKTWTVSDNYTLPAHSFTVIAIPCTGIIGVDDNSKELEFNIYPNPVKDIFTVRMNYEFKNIIKFELYTVLGEVVAEKLADYPLKELIFDMNKFSAGTYFLVVKTKEGTITKKIVKF